MVDDTTTNPETPPAVPARLRTVVYFVALTFGVVGLVVSGAARIYLEEGDASNINDLVSVVNNAFLFLTGALGVAYRPTR